MTTVKTNMKILGNVLEDFKNGYYMVEVQDVPEGYKYYTCNYDELIEWFGNYECVKILPIEDTKNMYIAKVKSKI